ncbi:MAG: UDP-N-acetylmuramoyl-L-alanyl-D-glutamate--2,6-diaminopimelate ligase [Planctomycetes bacterium]|nr:UDP-N-acetylmuramoyl-L-alanyl-D-glutamate--2,6-diaminopimelate ligase [Planctomycetota bacterium]
MTLAELIAGLDVTVPGGADQALMSRRICDVTEDSRTVQPGSLFLARSGTKVDGRKFIGDALKQGAAVVLAEGGAEDVAATNAETRAPGPVPGPVVVTTNMNRVAAQVAERFYGSPGKKLALSAVTGTNGKTTTAWIAWQMLNQAGVRTGLVGTVAVDDGREVAPAGMTTLPAVEMSRSLATMVESGCAGCVMETSSHALDQERVGALDFAVGVFTNLTGDHLDYHKTMERYASAKAKLFERLKPGSLAVVNVETEWSARMLRDCAARVLRCSVIDQRSDERDENAATVRAVEHGLRHTLMELRGPWGVMVSRVPLTGRYNLMNVLQAACIAHEMGLSVERMERALATASVPPGRLQCVSDEADDVTVFVDYAHTDDGLVSVLTALREAMKRDEGGGRLVCVFGCGGDRDRTKRPRMGKAASELADVVMLTSDNPRSENPGAIIEEVLTGVNASRRNVVQVQVDRAAAIQHAVRTSRPGDVVIIAGKGHEEQQVFADGKGGYRKVHFSDVETAREALKMRK